MPGASLFKLLPTCCLLTLLTACSADDATLNSSELAANLAAPYDYYINGMHTIRYTATGVRSYQLSADKVTHYPTDDHAELVEPDLLWYRDNSTPWTLTAAEGNLHHDLNGEDELSLSGNVKLSTTLAVPGTVLVETEQLDVLLVARLARTAAAVTLTTPRDNMQSNGMQVSLLNNHIELLDQVRGIHAP